MMNIKKYALVLSTIFVFGSALLAQASKMSAGTVTYYLGEVKMTSPSGQPFGSTLSLVKRSMDPAVNQIVEIVTTIDPKKPTEEYTTVITVKDGAFGVKDNEGTFTGSGKLSGPAWNWTSWSYSVEMLGERKGTLTAEDKIVDGRIVVTKSYFSADKQLRVKFLEELMPISPMTYEILHSKVMSKSQ